MKTRKIVDLFLPNSTPQNLYKSTCYALNSRRTPPSNKTTFPGNVNLIRLTLTAASHHIKFDISM